MGLLIPFLGTAAGSACVFFLRKELRLGVPQVTLLAHELRQSGVPLPDAILTRKELVEALKKCR